MKIYKDPDELAAVLRDLSEAGLVEIVNGAGGEASFTLSAAITRAGPGAIAALLAGIEAIADPRHSA
jgi:hypothetical protein